MSLLPSEDITTAIKQSVDIVELIGEHVNLVRSGHVHKGLCPFHDDHNPSMVVDPSRSRYKCWSCGAEGDIFTFVMEYMKLGGFREAIEYLAQRARIELPKNSSRFNTNTTAKNAALDALEWASEVYAYCLWERPQGEPGREYLKKRGIGEETARAYKLGFVPDQWDYLVEIARRKNVKLELLDLAGLVTSKASGNGFYDRFRGRLMFPIVDLHGKVIAFGGRVLPEYENEKNPGKYINSPETKVYKKSEQLYGLYQARDDVVRRGASLVMEGYTDCIVAHQEGFPNAVAPLGTALGDQQVKVLKRFADRIYLVFDGDEAGQKSSDRALSLFMGHQVDLRVLSLPGSQDPCDYLQSHGAEKFAAALEESVDALEFKLRRAEQIFDVSTHDGVRKAVDFVLEAIAGLPTLPSGNMGLTRDIMLDRLSRRYGVPLTRIHQRLREIQQSLSGQRVGGGTGSGPSLETQPVQEGLEDPAERELLEVVLADPSQIDKVATELKAEQVEQWKSPSLKQILQECLAMFQEGVAVTFDSIRIRLDDPRLVQRVTLLTEAGILKGQISQRLTYVLNRFRVRELKQRIQGHKQLLTKAAGKDIRDILREIDELQRTLQTLSQFEGS